MSWMIGGVPSPSQAFEKAMNAMGPPAAPAPDMPDKLPPMDPKSKGTADKDTDVPSLSDLGYQETARSPFKVHCLSV